MKQASFDEVCNRAKRYFNQFESAWTIRIARNGGQIADITPAAGRRCGMLSAASTTTPP